MQDTWRDTSTAAPLAESASALANLAFREGQRLKHDSNICGVGQGVKLQSGEPIAVSALVFFVREKLQVASEIAARGSWQVPAEVDGFVTDVVEVGQLLPAATDRSLPAGGRGTRVEAPLLGGAATMALGKQAPGPMGYGTLGGHCFDASTNVPGVLSNAHVWGTIVGDEVAQPVMATSLFGAATSPAVTGSPQSMVGTRILIALATPVAFANAVAQAYLITGSDDDPLVVGQGATSVPAATRTDSEEVRVATSTAAFPPAGRRLNPTLSWTYRRLATTQVLQSAAAVPRPPTKLLTARRLFTNQASYSGSQVVSLYAEIIPAAGGLPQAVDHFPIAFVYPATGGTKFVPRMLRPSARQVPATVTTAFTGFPAPAQVGPASLPFRVGGFTIDSEGAGEFKTSTAGTLPGGTLALQLPSSALVFVPPSTQVVLDIDIRTVSGTLGVVGVSSAGDSVGVVTIPTAQSSGRTLVTIDASELVEVRLTNAASAVLYGVTSKRGSPETTPPLAYTASINAADLNPKGTWAASLFVQATASGVTESANVVETAIGTATLLADCTFQVL